MFWLGQCSHAVEAYAKGRQVVEHGGGGWRQDTCHAKTDQCPVEPDDKAVVVLDAAHQTYGQLPQAHQLPQTVGGNGDVGDLPGNGGPVADGDTGVRLREGRRVVDAIPHHQYGVPLPPHSSHILCLIRWENPGPEVVYPQLLCNGSSGTRAVPGQHHQVFYAQIPQGREDRPRLLPQRIGDADHGGEYPVDGKIELGDL